MTSIQHHKMLIDGKFVAGEGVAETIINPSTGEVIANIKEASLAQVEQATKSAAIAFPAWSKTTPKDRATMLLALADKIDAHAAELAQSALVGLGAYMAWKYFLVALLTVHFVNKYVYFGRHPIWKYMNATAGRLLSPSSEPSPDATPVRR